MTPERIAELRRLCGAATPGPWKCWGVWGPVKGTDFMAVSRIGPEAPEWAGIVADPLYPPNADFYAKREDAEFVAIARTALPEALDEIERLRAENERLRGLLGQSDAWLCESVERLRREHPSLYEHIATIEALRAEIDAELGGGQGA